MVAAEDSFTRRQNPLVGLVARPEQLPADVNVNTRRTCSEQPRPHTSHTDRPRAFVAVVHVSR